MVYAYSCVASWNYFTLKKTIYRFNKDIDSPSFQHSFSKAPSMPRIYTRIIVIAQIYRSRRNMETAKWITLTIRININDKYRIIEENTTSVPKRSQTVNFDKRYFSHVKPNRKEKRKNVLFSHRVFQRNSLRARLSLHEETRALSRSSTSNRLGTSLFGTSTRRAF